MNGIINVYKPAGMTSFQCVAKIRKITNTKKAGHAGTLDPEASGVLPICIGVATKCTELFLKCNKSYFAEITLGIDTDTYDIWGSIITKKDVSSITETKVKEATQHFTGEIKQVPPMYSAIKKNGVPMYKLARLGEVLELEPRVVNIYSAELCDFKMNDTDDGMKTATANIKIECSKGTYIRSLCHDIGEYLGCGGCMSKLERTSYGNLLVKDAITPDELEIAVEKEDFGFLMPMERIMEEIPKLSLSDSEMKDYLNGKIVNVSASRLSDNDNYQEIRIYYHDELYALSKGEKDGDNITLKTWKYFKGV